MHPDTRLVSQLQAIDLRMAELEKEVAALPKHIAVIEKTLESHQRRLEADRAALTANQKDRKKLEGDVQMNEQKISKLRDQMLGAKTNEQYRAFQHEIEYAQNEIRKAEDRILELMSESESLDVAVKKAEAALQGRKETGRSREDPSPANAPPPIRPSSNSCKARMITPPRPNCPSVTLTPAEYERIRKNGTES